MDRNILITGGAGFIGSHLVKKLVKKYNNYAIYNLDNLTYSGNLLNLIEIENYPNYTFLKGDINDSDYVKKIFKKYKFDSIIHLAAESHVDRSINNPIKFAQTNIIGTIVLLNEFKNNIDYSKRNLFYHISTDEVYGSLGSEGYFTELTPYDPNSPYSASKASSDHFVRAFGETYKIPYIISNCSNNYGPNQFPEKLIPLFINNIINNKDLPVYGNGEYTRDWLYVEDHIDAIDTIFHCDFYNQTFNIGGNNELTNNELVNLLCKKMDKKLNLKNSSKKLIKNVSDRPGHDLRYAIDASKIKKMLGWVPNYTFNDGLEKTIHWYLNNQDWLNKVTSGEYMKYYKKEYKLS